MKKTMVRTFLTFLAALSFVNTAQGRPALHLAGQAGTYRSTPARAVAYLKATYTAPDTVRLKSAQDRLDRDLAAGLPETDARVIRDRQYVADAMKGARVDRATCKGVGKPVLRRYGKFSCSAHLIGTGEWATDGFSATVKLTVVPTGPRSFRVR